jgi:hypothetical protein
MMNLIVLGNVGSDAGYWVYGPGGWHHVGGWGVESLAEVKAALQIIAEAPRLKTPGLADATTRGLVEFVQKELAAHVKEGGKEGGIVVL